MGFKPYTLCLYGANGKIHIFTPLCNMGKFNFLPCVCGCTLSLAHLPGPNGPICLCTALWETEQCLITLLGFLFSLIVMNLVVKLNENDSCYKTALASESEYSTASEFFSVAPPNQP